MAPEKMEGKDPRESLMRMIGVERLVLVMAERAMVKVQREGKEPEEDGARSGVDFFLRIFCVLRVPLCTIETDSRIVHPNQPHRMCASFPVHEKSRL